MMFHCAAGNEALEWGWGPKWEVGRIGLVLPPSPLLTYVMLLTLSRSSSLILHVAYSNLV